MDKGRSAPYLSKRPVQRPQRPAHLIKQREAPAVLPTSLCHRAVLDVLGAKENFDNDDDDDTCKSQTAQSPANNSWRNPAARSAIASTSSRCALRVLLAKISANRHSPFVISPQHQRGRLDDCAISIFPTAPHAFQTSSASAGPASLAAPENLRLNEPFQQPDYPDRASPVHPELQPPHHYQSNLQSQNRSQSRRLPFGNRSLSLSGSKRPRRLSSSRLWNPTNSTPRNSRTKSHKRRPSSPTEPPIPLHHPELDISNNTADPAVHGAGDYPLLTLTEHRQTRHSASTRVSYQFERSGKDDHRVSLPKSVRASYDESRRSQNLSPTTAEFQTKLSSEFLQSDASPIKSPTALDKGKGIMLPGNEDSRRSYSKDLEHGPDIMDNRLSNVSAGDGIGSAISSSNSSIMGEEVLPDLGDAWGPQHPCYPHLNPHVPIDSADYAKTRIIRIRRDWLLQGDLAPTFSNLYPEILDPAGVSEPEFRRIIDKVNKELVPAFDPYAFRNILDAALGLVTGWLWDDFGLTAIKGRLNNLENWIEKWNREMEKTTSSEEGILPPKLVSLRRTGYMTLDIQIPDPEIAPAPSSTGAGESRTALPLEPAAAVIAV